MRYTRTQIYLDPDDHRWLTEEARARGISLTALIREIVTRFARDATPPRPRGFASLIGVVEGEPSDVARRGRTYRDAAIDRRLSKKLGDEPARAERRQKR